MCQRGAGASGDGFIDTKYLSLVYEISLRSFRMELCIDKPQAKLYI